jgi:hypothetical protein
MNANAAAMGMHTWSTQPQDMRLDGRHEGRRVPEWWLPLPVGSNDSRKARYTFQRRHSIIVLPDSKRQNRVVFGAKDLDDSFQATTNSPF